MEDRTPFKKGERVEMTRAGRSCLAHLPMLEYRSLYGTVTRDEMDFGEIMVLRDTQFRAQRWGTFAWKRIDSVSSRTGGTR